MELWFWTGMKVAWTQCILVFASELVFGNNREILSLDCILLGKEKDWVVAWIWALMAWDFGLLDIIIIWIMLTLVWTLQALWKNHLKQGHILILLQWVYGGWSLILCNSFRTLVWTGIWHNAMWCLSFTCKWLLQKIMWCHSFNWLLQKINNWFAFSWGNSWMSCCRVLNIDGFGFNWILFIFVWNLLQQCSAVYNFYKYDRMVRKKVFKIFLNFLTDALSLFTLAILNEFVYIIFISNCRQHIMTNLWYDCYCYW